MKTALIMEGGIADAVPFASMEKPAYKQNIILLTQPKNYRKIQEISAFLKKFLAAQAARNRIALKYPFLSASRTEALCGRL